MSTTLKVGDTFTVKGGKVVYTMTAFGDYGKGRTIKGRTSHKGVAGIAYFRADRVVKL